MLKNVHQLPVRMSKTDYEALKAYAHFTGSSMNEVMVRAVREFLLDSGRDEQFEAMLAKVQTRYRAVLDKLAEL